MRIDDAIQAYLQAAQADGLRPATLKWYRSILAAFAKRFSGQDLSTVTPVNIRAYIIAMRESPERYTDSPQKPPQHGGLSDETVRSHITALHAFWGWTAREYGIQNPMANIRRGRRSKPVPKAIQAADYIALFNACSEPPAGARDRALLAVFADTGARLGGVLSLTLDNLDLERRRAVLVEKGGKYRTVYYTLFTAQLIQRWLYFRVSESDRVFTSVTTGGALTESGVNQVLKRLKKRAKVTGRVNPHSFRHGFAREYLLSGGDVVTLARLLGHEDINTTAAYYAVFTDDELSALHDRYTPMNKLRGIESARDK